MIRTYIVFSLISFLFGFAGANFASQPVEKIVDPIEMKEKNEVILMEGTIVGLEEVAQNGETQKLIIVLDGDDKRRSLKTNYSKEQLTKIGNQLNNPKTSKKIILPIIDNSFDRGDIILSDPKLHAIVFAKPTKTADTSCRCSVQ